MLCSSFCIFYISFGIMTDMTDLISYFDKDGLKLVFVPHSFAGGTLEDFVSSFNPP